MGAGDGLASDQLETLTWVVSLGAVTAEALALRAGVSVASARGRLTVLVRRGLLARERPLVGMPALYAARGAALRACGARGIDPCRVSPHNALHLIECAFAAAALERCYPDHRVVGERELRRDEREHGQALASAEIGLSYGGEARLHRPDIVLWPGEGEVSRRVRGQEMGENPPHCFDPPPRSDRRAPVAVEVELTVKAPARLLEICRAWARCRVVAGVLYLAAPGPVEQALARAIAAVRAEERIVVVSLEVLRAQNHRNPHVPSIAGEIS
jgi:hypothetical protein